MQGSCRNIPGKARTTPIHLFYIALFDASAVTIARSVAKFKASVI